MKDLKIFNGTPHAINIVVGSEFMPTMRKHVGGQVVKTIPSNGMLNAIIETIELEPVAGIPMYSKRIVSCDELPTEEYDLIIVSALYSSAIQKSGVDYSMVRTIVDPVYSEDGLTIVGCKGLAPLF